MLLLALVFGSTISFENPGIRLELFLREMSRQAGEEFHCPVSLKDEVLAASFQDQPIETVKTQLATVIHGTWEKKEGDWWLIQSSEQKKEETRWNQSQRRQLYQWQIDVLKKLAPKAEWTSAEAEQYWIQYKAARNKKAEGTPSLAQRKVLGLKSPENRFAESVVSQLKPEFFNFEGLTPDFRRYTANGLPGHTSIPVEVAPLIQRLQNETDLFDALSGQKEENKAKPVHMEIRIGPFEVPEFNIYVYDKDWNYYTSCWASYEVDKSELMAKGEEFALTPGTQAMVNFANQLLDSDYDQNDLSPTKANPLFKEAAEIMTHAVDTDPLGILQGRCWIDFAKSRKMPLLVSLEEDVYQMRPKLFVPTVDQEPMALGMKRVDQGGWVLGRPKNPLYNRSGRIDRESVQRMSRLVLGPTYQSLEALVPIVSLYYYGGVFRHGIPNAQFLIGYEYRGNGVFCLLGTLTPAQLNSCIRGERIPAERLPERAKDFLMSLGSNTNLNELSPLIQTGEYSSPIYCLPNGIQGMSLGASESMETRFKFVEAIRPNEWRDPDGLGLKEFAAEIKDALAHSSPLLDAKFRIGTQKTLKAILYLGNKSIDQRMGEPLVEQKETYTWKTLPESIKDQVLEAMKGSG